MGCSHVAATRNLEWLNHLFHTSWGKLLPETLQCASQLNREFSSSTAFYISFPGKYLVNQVPFLILSPCAGVARFLTGLHGCENSLADEDHPCTMEVFVAFRLE